MIFHQPDQPRIVFLFSDTGGGHRSAATAIIEALNIEFPDQTTTEMVDIFKQYAPPPLDLAPELYPPLSRVPDVWGFGYRVSDNQRRTRLLYNALWPYVRWSVNRLLRENPCDLFVSVHPIINAAALRALGQPHIPYIIVVTDLVSTHVTWYDPRADLIIVPTESARQRGIQLGMPPEKLKVIGLPVADRFCQDAGDRQVLRKKLGWPEDIPVILLVGGGEGMGPLESVAHAINQARFPAALAIIAGRNQHLKEKLEKKTWNMPTKIYGFVKEMPDFMRAADILVTKAGPGTISEAFIANLPIILYSRVPGQEEGNVSYVVDEGAGIWAPEPELVVEAIQNWLAHPERRRQAVQACQRLARPQASRKIARIIAEAVGLQEDGHQDR